MPRVSPDPNPTPDVRLTLILNDPEPEVEDVLRGEVERLRERGHEVRPQLTFESGDARRLAREGAARGSDLVVAVGGDGTVNEVVNGLHDHLREHGDPSAGTLQGTRLAIVPTGTANDFAATLEIPQDPREAVRAALHGAVLEVDVAQVGNRSFVNVSTGGMGAEATEEATEEAKRALGPLAYLITGAKKFVSLEVSEARFVADGEPVYEGPFLIFAVGNSRRAGGGNWITPRADPADGLLDLCVVKEISRMQLLKLLPDLRSGRHLDHPGVLYRQVPRVLVESEHELSVNADGEPLRGRRFDYRMSPYRIGVMVP